MGKQCKKAQAEAGIFMIMLAGILLALITIVALFFASSFLSANKTRLQNSTNFASLAAIERYVRAEAPPGDPSLTYNERANAARDQANAILDSQALLGTGTSGAGSVGGLGYVGQDAAGGEITLGVWYPTKSTSPPHPCGVGPCFSAASPQPGGTDPAVLPGVNAIKLNVETPHPFNVPLLSLLGFDSLAIESEAIAAVVPRCTVFVLDTSKSSQEQSHFGTRSEAAWPLVTATGPTTDPTFNCYGTDYYHYARPRYYTCPRNLMPFAFDHEQLFSPDGGLVNPEEPTTSLCDVILPNNDDDTYDSLQGKIWCNLEYHQNQRRRFGVSPPYSYPPPDGMPQLPEYYRVMNSPSGNVVVDTLNRPQPLSDFLLGFNAGTRMMIRQASQSDKAGIVVFQGGITDKFPNAGLSTDLGYIAQVTNADRINPGWVGPPSASNPPNTPEHPNFIDRGWFARLEVNTGSNIILGLDRAISLLGDSNACPESAQKSIILASDGIMNCTYDSSSLPNPWSCDNAYSRYLESEAYLLDRGFDTGLAQDSILRRMQRSGISFSMFIAGPSGPNIVNRFISNASEPNGGHFVNFDEARALGMTSMPPLEDPSAADSTIFVDSRSHDIPQPIYEECENNPTIWDEIKTMSTEERNSACSFYKLGRDGVSFRRPLAAFYKVAVETGGWYCPFLAKAPPGSYSGPGPDAKLTHAYRASLPQNAAISVNPFNRNTGQEATVCAQQTLGLNPFILVREED